MEKTQTHNKIFKIMLPQNQACDGAILSSWAKLGGVSITALDVTEEYNNLKQSLLTNKKEIQNENKSDRSAGSGENKPSTPAK